jgi:hypothetical protein
MQNLPNLKYLIDRNGDSEAIHMEMFTGIVWTVAMTM